MADNLSRYLQGEKVDVITAKKTADAVVRDWAIVAMKRASLRCGHMLML